MISQVQEALGAMNGVRLMKWGFIVVVVLVRHSCVPSYQAGEE